MNVVEKIKEVKQEVEAITAEEKAIRSRINDLKNLVAEKQKRAASLEELKQEEEQLLKELGL